MTKEAQFFLGLGSRYSYLAATQVETLEKDTGCFVTWLPMASGALMTRRGQNPFAARDAEGNWSGMSVSGQYNKQYRRTDLQRWAKLYDVPYQEPVVSKMEAKRRTLYCVAAEMLGQAARFCLGVFKSLYIDNIAITEGHCLRIARELGIDAEKLRDLVDTGAADKRHDEIIAFALALKVFGVPSFVVDGELFWGNDRLGLLRHHLTQAPC